MSHKLSATRIARDKHFILDHQADWPAAPILPMKKASGGFNNSDYCALMFAGDTTTLYLTNMMCLLGAHGKTWKEVLAKFPQRKFDSLDDLLNAYMVD